MALRCLRQVRSWSVLVGLALWTQVSAGHADPASLAETGGGRVAQADTIRTTDHARFVGMLSELHRAEADLTTSEKWYLRFLDGWEANFEGRYPDAEANLRDVMAHANSDAVVTRATAMLMNSLNEQGKYAEAYAMATRAADTLPDVTDPTARFVLLANLSQLMTFAGQPELALKYADMMLAATPAGQSPCQAMVQRATALEGSRQLTSQSPELLKTIDICTADRQPIFANTMSLVLVDRLFEEHKLAEALAVADRLSPAIRASQYFSHIIDLAGARARIYEQMGNATEARQAALDVLAMGHEGDINDALRYA